MSVSVENFVKAIYKQSKLAGNDTRLSTLAGILSISNAAATDMARNLAAKNLVNYTKYKPLTLAEKGNELALNVIRKHRLWESFLYRTLNLSLHEIHIEAEQLEHSTSDFLAGQIEKFLGNPTLDPHGDPIPAFNGQMETDQTQIRLSEAKSEQTYQISRLSGSGKEFFDFCNSIDIQIGSSVWVEQLYISNKMTEIKIDQKTILLHEDFTNLIFVKPIN